MTYIAARLRALRKQQQITQLELAGGIGVSKSAISMYENGQREPDFETLEKLAAFFRVPMTTFFPGVEDSAHSLPSNLEPMPLTVKKPRLGTIACGKPILAVEEAEQFDPVPHWMDCDFTLRCKGDSMINARIFDGDIVYIRAQPQVENGEIAAVRVGDEATLKRVMRYPDKLVLEAANPLYDPLVFRGEEMNQVQILGKVIAFTCLVI